MKKTQILALLLTLFLVINASGQESFTYGQEGISPKYLVVKVDNLSQNELFTKTVEWVKKNYRNPDEVIKMTIENKVIRLEGFATDLICIKSLGVNVCYNAFYTLEITFKESRYKITPVEVAYTVPPNEYAAGRTVYLDLASSSPFYKKNGKLLSRSYKQIPNDLATLFNELNTSIFSYLSSKNDGHNDEDW